ncbi:Aste57867_16158 [Aphanomyces stellatus]|uniref:Aste57867_16158 protein n=1 Tax=Aphanomyces stellatus TaxID=120398 RepID=A0A485L6N3_9STRA|nr:hypothetical protein As57867_016102 [Aphanomyces stellatus]VFT92937.1 Aste57867_16158 [Aphanomyces stellatus]
MASGTWHFTEVVLAQRRSFLRDAGTPVMKTVPVTRDIYKSMLEDTRKVKIQQDNARPHVPPLGLDVVAACKADGWDMEVVFQPPNSPDMNVLDLGFFRAIQTLQSEKSSRSLEEIVSATESAWLEVSMNTLNKNFVTLQSCLKEVILA